MQAWLQLVATYSGPRPELATAVLEVVRRYVNWIDIGLVANDRQAASTGGVSVKTPSCLCKSCSTAMPRFARLLTIA